MTVADLKQKIHGFISNNTLTLPANALDSADIQAVIETHLADNKLVIKQVTVTDSSTDVTVSGKFTFLSTTITDATAVFQPVESELTMTLTALLPTSWTFSQTFPSLKGSFYDQLELTGSKLVLTSTDQTRHGTLKKGLNFNGNVAAQGPLAPVTWLLAAKGPLTLLGPITFEHGVPKITLQLEKQADIKIGHLNLPILVGLITTPTQMSAAVALLSGKPAYQKWVPINLINVKSDLIFKGKIYPICGSCTSPKGFLYLDANLGNVPLSGLSDVSDIVNGAGLQEALPAASALSNFSLHGVRLGIDLATKHLSSVSLSIHSSKSWTVIEKILAVDQVNILFTVINPGDSNQQNIITTIRGEFDLNGEKLKVCTEVPNFQTYAALASGSTIKLATVIKQFFPADAGLPALSCTELALSADPASKNYTVLALLSGDWRIPIGMATLDITEVGMSIVHTGSGQSASTTGTLTGTTKVGDASFDVTWQLPSALKLEGTIPSINLSDLAKQLLQDFSLPSDLPDLELSDVEVSITPKTGAFSLNGQLSNKWELDLGFSKLNLAFDSIELTHTNGAQQTTMGKLSGTTQLAGASFDFDLKIPGKIKIAGTLPQINLQTLIKNLCGELSPFKELFDNGFDLTLEKSEICIQKDDTKGMCSLATKVEGFGTILLYIKSNPTAIVVAFDLPDEWKLSSIPGLPEDFDGINFSQNLLLISSLDDPAFQLPGLELFDSSNLPNTFKEIPGNQGVKNGLTFHSVIVLNQDKFKDIADWLKFSSDLSLPLEIQISVDPITAELSASLPTDNGAIDVSGTKLTNPSLKMGVGMADPYFGVGATVAMEVNGQRIQVDGIIAVEPNGAEITADFSGTLSWNNFFGIPAAISVTDPAIEFGFSFQGLPTVGISGDFKADQLDTRLTIKLNTKNPAHSMVSGSINEISLAGLVQTFCESGVIIPSELSEVLSQSKLSDIEIYIVPTATTLGEKSYDQGFKFEGTLELMGFSGHAKVNLDPKLGVNFNMAIDQPIQVSNALILSEATGKKGPTMGISTYKSDPYINLHGKALVTGAFSGTMDLSVTSSQLHFAVTSKIFNAFNASVDATSSYGELSHSDFSLKITIEGAEFDKISGSVSDALKSSASAAKKAVDGANRGIADAQKEFDKINKTIKENNDAIAANKKKIQEIQGSL